MKIQLRMAVTTAVLVLSAATLPANAIPITYTLSGASATFSAPQPSATVALTGMFTYDPSGPDLKSVSITATETSGSGILTNTPETFSVAVGAFAPDRFTASVPTNNDVIVIAFNSNLGNVADSISFVAFTTPSGGFCQSGGSTCATGTVAGSAVPTTAPEPNTMALLGGAIGLFLVALRAGRRAHQTCPDQPAGA
jgi:hypothetical protein